MSLEQPKNYFGIWRHVDNDFKLHEGSYEQLQNYYLTRKHEITADMILLCLEILAEIIDMPKGMSKKTIYYEILNGQILREKAFGEY